MSELRTDPFTGRWVVIADERSRRPLPVAPPARLPPSDPADCPFCPGNEARTGPAIAERGHGEHRVRVVANRYPALRVEESGAVFGVPPVEGRTGLGAHEVVIETPTHDAVFADLPDAALASVLAAWRQRTDDLLHDVRLNHVLIYKNHEAAAGATLSHPHSQVVATPIVPPLPALKYARAEEHHAESGRCLYCDVLAEETRTGDRVVAERGRVLCVAPFASRVPFELMLLPSAHSARFERSSDEDLSDLASLLGTMLRRLRVSLEDPAYTLVLHTAARDTPDAAFHWHLEIVPRLVPLAGFEWGTGTYINPTRPEEAAAALRALVDVR
jgi:UDPglucose--hexose-1-phosphate uridylyltransferase